jgi:MinD superfamily P-loop ATPase
MFKIAIASGKGGTGKTFIATNLFYALLKNQVNAVLVDCDAEAPDAVAFFKVRWFNTTEVTQFIPIIDKKNCTFCGKCHEYCNYNSIFILPPMRIIQVIEDLCHGCGACSVACEFNAISEKPFSLGHITKYLNESNNFIIEGRTNIGVMSPAQVVKAAIRAIDNDADIALLDSPPGTSCPFVQTVSTADYVILVTEPTPFGLSDLKQSIEVLQKLNKPFGVIINRAGKGNKQVHKYLLDKDIDLLLEIPFSKDIACLYSTGLLAAEKDTLFEGQMLGVFETIFAQNGNSNYQR